MKDQAPAQSQTRHQVVSERAAQPRQSGGGSMFSDNRPASVAQRRHGDAADNSMRAVEHRALTTQIDNSPRMTAQRKQMDNIARPNRTGLPDTLKAGIESLSGMTLDHVKVHRNSSQPAQLNAAAYAQGSDIHLGPGQEQHLPHEAWHVVQQAKGRVPAEAKLNGVPLNTDRALEHEADEMGHRAMQCNAGRADADAIVNASATLQRQPVVQMAKPGPIQHAINSCFVAALINVFTVTNSLKNLLIPAQNDLSANDEAHALQFFLLHAVNSVDAGQPVPEVWVRNTMVALADCGIIQNAIDTDDVNTLITGTIHRLTPVDLTVGQPNHMPVSAGEAVWSPQLSLVETAASSVQQLQDDQNDVLGASFPNVIHINRMWGNQLQAPQTFNLYSGTGAPIAYRMRAAIHRDGGYKGGHFVSYIDRGGDGAQEWWESDDLAADTRQVQGINAVDNAQPDEAHGKKTDKAESSSRGTLSAIGPKGSAESEADEESDMQVLATAYVYERTGVAAEAQARPPLVGELEEQGEWDQKYRQDLIAYFAREELTPNGDLETLDLTQFDSIEFEQEHAKLAGDAPVGDSAFRLPAISTSEALLPEMNRQLRMQLDALNRLSVRDWVLNTLINRMKTSEALIQRYATKGGRQLAGRIDTVLSRDNELANMVLAAVVERMTALVENLTANQNLAAAALAQGVLHKANAAQTTDTPYMRFVAANGIREMERLSRLSLQGGIGRQHGTGDEQWFRKEHALGVTHIDSEQDHQLAVLHNPDQVAGGPMEILHDPAARRQITLAKANLERARARVVEAEAVQSRHAATSIPARKLTGGSLKAYFAVKPGEAEAYQPELLKKKEEDAQSIESRKTALDLAWRVYLGLVTRHLGSSAVNSALGAAWVEPTGPHGGTTRVALLLEHALSIPREQWAETSMNVAMNVAVKKSSTRKERRKTDEGKAKKQAEHQKALHGKKKRKRSVSGNKDKKLAKIARDKKTGRDVTLAEFFFRQNLKKKKTAESSDQPPPAYIVISDDEDEERSDDDTSQSGNEDMAEEGDDDGGE